MLMRVYLLQTTVLATCLVSMYLNAENLSVGFVNLSSISTIGFAKLFESHNSWVLSACTSNIDVHDLVRTLLKRSVRTLL